MDHSIQVTSKLAIILGERRDEPTSRQYKRAAISDLNPTLEHPCYDNTSITTIPDSSD